MHQNGRIHGESRRIMDTAPPGVFKPCLPDRQIASSIHRSPRDIVARMNQHESPIEVTFDVSRIYKERLADVASFQFRNRADEQFHLIVNLRSRIFSRPVEVVFHLEPAQVRTHRIPVELPCRETCPQGRGSSGRHPIKIMLLISEGPTRQDERHQFIGEKMTTVLEHDASEKNIVNHINVKIEQHGEKAGWGAINEINMPPSTTEKDSESNNDLLQRLNKLPAAFDAVPLDYDGLVDGSRGAIPSLLDRTEPTPPLDRCTIEEVGTRSKILVLAGRSVTLGKRRKDVDVTTWNLPRSPSNDERTKRISGVQCRLEMTSEGICVEQRSATNPTRLDREDVQRRTPLNLRGISHLDLPGGFRLELIPQQVPAEFTRHAAAWRRLGGPAFQDACSWSERTHVGGLLIRRTDAYRTLEEYLWVLSAVGILRPGGGRTPFVVAAVEGLHIAAFDSEAKANLRDEGSQLALGENAACPLTIGDAVSWSDGSLEFDDWKQAGLDDD